MRCITLIAGGGALAVSQASFASASDLEDVITPSAADYAAATKVIDPIIARLIEGNARTAINSAFKDHPLGDRIAPQLPNLVGQLTTMYEVYGPISSCEQAQRSSVGSMAIRLVYNCQHETYVTRWDYQLVKAKGGYILSTINFSDP